VKSRILSRPLPPAPKAATAAVRRRMQRQPRLHTSCEMVLRRLLHARGLRYRVDARPVLSYRRRADIVFRSVRVAVFVDGCFWHGCGRHGSKPKTNSSWWATKIARNRARDIETTQFLKKSGWTVVRVWEHENVDRAAERITGAVRKRRVSSATG